MSSITDNITVVIPSYNEDKYIYNALWSLSRQRIDGKLTVIIADANSTDDTLGIISKAAEDFDNLQIQVIEGGPVAYGRNKGAELVKTPYILFMDADSVLFENDILHQVNQERVNYTIIGCKQKTTTKNALSKLTWSIFELVRKVMPESFCTGCFFFISKEHFNSLGRFDESLNNSEDFWLSRKVKKQNFKILDRYVGQDNRRFKKMGYIKFLKILLLNYWHKNNIEWFKKDVGYWESYE